MTLTEVICDHPAKGLPFGMTFHDRRTAYAFAIAMRSKGYIAKISPPFDTEPDLATALDHAAKYFDATEPEQGP